MKEPEFKLLLDREQRVSEVEDHYGEQIRLLRDLVNYGTALSARTFDSSKKSLTDLVILGSLLRQHVSMLDATEVLLSHSIANAAYLQARSAFEATIALHFVLSEDSDLRAKHYFVASLRQRRAWANRMVVGSPEYEKYTHVREEFQLDIQVDNLNGAEWASKDVEAM